MEILRQLGFEVNEKQVIEAIIHPDRLDERNKQFFATEIQTPKRALRVVHENRKDFLVIITFYPVRRERFGL